LGVRLEVRARVQLLSAGETQKPVYAKRKRWGLEGQGVSPGRVVYGLMLTEGKQCGGFCWFYCTFQSWGKGVLWAGGFCKQWGNSVQYGNNSESLLVAVV